MATRSETIRFRVTPQEREELERKAGGNMSDYIRKWLGLDEEFAESHTLVRSPSEETNPLVEFDKRVRQLQAKGMTGPVARATARQEMEEK